ncbi:MAG TPA: UDP-2,3-diacylglucosamine diphosphatase [Steroidobacteraceae bacterium]|nr:UDP-2,3-diacylglucosamine diphosphatase [Steroidobacteraceae bacterium]HRX89569.1 UDP-2,3-diacylglucosamine diphosphatase [Steroidobacteraceae bacterium]
MASLFVSDLHLDPGSPWAVETLVTLLRGPARAAESLYILGDLFEAWVGDDQLDTANTLEQRVTAELAQLTAQGVACYLLHGNRDFLLGARFARTAGAILLPDPVVADLDGVRTLLTHGDVLCTDDAAYQELRSIVRTPGWQQRFLELPRSTREQLAGAARAGSRAHMQRAQPVIMDVNEAAVLGAFRATGTRRMIHGHTHRPAVHRHQVDGQPATRVVLDAWYEHGSYLRVSGESIDTIELPRT